MGTTVNVRQGSGRIWLIGSMAFRQPPRRASLPIRAKKREFSWIRSRLRI